MLTNSKKSTLRVLMPRQLGGVTVATDRVDVAAEDAAVHDDAVDEHEHGEHDERDRDALVAGEGVGEDSRCRR